MNWNRIVNKIKPYVVKIESPKGYGTGFLCLYNYNKSWCGIATALHVVAYADKWQQPIKIINQQGQPLFLKADSRVIIIDQNTDSAMILFPKAKDYQLPDDLIRLRPLDCILDIGSEVGWLGYPYLEQDKLCFFSGCISARNEEKKYYLIDGVSINGVSGGPVLSFAEEGTEIIGIICAYMANVDVGSNTPGLSIAQDVSHFHKVGDQIKTIDDANKRKQELIKEQGKKEEDKEKSLPAISANPSNSQKAI